MRCESIEFECPLGWIEIWQIWQSSQQLLFYCIIVTTVLNSLITANYRSCCFSTTCSKYHKSVDLTAHDPNPSSWSSHSPWKNHLLSESVRVRSPNYQSAILTSWVGSNLHLVLPSPLPVCWYIRQKSTSKELDDTFATFQVQQPVDFNRLGKANRAWCGDFSRAPIFSCVGNVWKCSNCCWEKMGHTPWFLLEVAMEKNISFVDCCSKIICWKKRDWEAMTAKVSSKKPGVTWERLVQIWWIVWK